MKVSLIQMESKGSKQQNETKALNMLIEACKEKPDIICLSELFLSWGEEFNQGTVSLEDIRIYTKLAKDNNVNILLGSVALKNEVSNKITNSCFAINRKGEIVKRYDKKYMYKVNKEHFKVDETLDTIPGEEMGIVEIDNVKVGIGICFDLRFPEYFRELTKQGTQVIFLPAHFRKNTGEKAWEILTIARAIENQVYFCACNQTGEELCGKSRIVSYTGETIKQMDNEEGILTAELDLKKQEKFRKEFPVLEQI